MNRHFDGSVYYQVAVVKNLPTLTKLALNFFCSPPGSAFLK